MKRLLAMLLILCLALCGCAAKEPETFEMVDDNGDYSLYYYNYTQDYGFDTFLEEGGVEDTEELVEFCQDQFPEMELEMENLGYGCSSFCAESENGDIIFGRNFDMNASNTGTYVIVHTDPKGGYESYSTVNLDFLGIDGEPDDPIGDEESVLQMLPYIPLDGINEKGLVICVLQLNYNPIDANGSGKIDFTPTTMIRHVLDNAANVEEAIEFFEEADLHTEGYAYHFMIADAKGNCAVVEYVDDELVVTYMDDEIMACANTFVSEEGREYYHVYDGNESDRRTDAILEMAEEVDFELDTDNAMEVLAAAHQSTTRWSIVYNLSEGTLAIAINGDIDETYEYSFD